MNDETSVADRFNARIAGLERIRTEITRRQRVTLVAFLPVAIAAALIIPYMQIVLTLEDADYYYVLERPSWATYLRLASPALFASIITVGLIGFVWRQIDEFMPTPGRLLIFGGIFGGLMPLVIGLLTPLNLFVIGITGVSNVENQGSVQQMIGDWVFSTPMFTFLFWADWLGPGIMLGMVAGLAFWVVVRLLGPVEAPRSASRLVGGSMFAGVVMLVLVTIWPFGLFSFLFQTLR